MRDMFNFAEANNECIEFESWNEHYTNRVIRVPVVDEDNFVKRAKNTKWMKNVLTSALKKEEPEASNTIFKEEKVGNSIRCLIDYCHTVHPKETEEALTDLGLAPKPMNEYEMAATMKECGIGIATFRQVKTCCTTFMRMKRGQFSKSEESWRILGNDHGKIDAGTYDYHPPKKGTTAKQRVEKVQWWTMDAVDELELRLTDIANSTDDFHPSKLSNICSIYTGDHGKGKLRFGSKLVAWLKQAVMDKDKWEKLVRIYPLADVKCRKDNGEIFKGTIKDNLATAINRVEHGKAQFKQNDDGKWECKIIDPGHADFEKESDLICEVTAFMIGDLKFLSMMLGKENFDTYWCYLCMLSHADWQKYGHDVGEMWSLDKLIDQAEKSENLEGAARKGVREEPYFDIPLWRYIWPVLHTLIGVGNDILDYLIDIVESEIQALPAKEIRMKRELRDMEKEDKEMVEARDYFDSKNEGSGTELIKKYRQEKRVGTTNKEQMEDDGKQDELEYKTLCKKLEELEADIQKLLQERKDMSTDIDNLRKRKKNKREGIAAFRKARKTEADSLYSKIDDILSSFQIKRASYHGGDLTGECAKTLMQNANEIMEKISVLLLADKSPECRMEPAAIRKLCTDVSKLLILWDSALSKLHTEWPSEEDCSKAQEFIDAAMKMSRALGISVTVKHHGGESHLVSQMRKLPMGLFEFDESWGEQYHQKGYSFDMNLRNQGSELRKAKVRAGNERRENRAETLEASEKLKANKRGKRKATIEREKSRKKALTEQREAALEE